MKPTIIEMPSAFAPGWRLLHAGAEPPALAVGE